MKEWQFNVLFFVGVGGAILLLLGPEIGLNLGDNPTALTGVGAILTYVLAQKMATARQKDGDAKRDDAEKKNEQEKDENDGLR